RETDLCRVALHAGRALEDGLLRIRESLHRLLERAQVALDLFLPAAESSCCDVAKCSRQAA
ncbi:MAG: hypothetical protein AB7I25_13880, partial [Vicinamibacterales bacterium]